MAHDVEWLFTNCHSMSQHGKPVLLCAFSALHCENRSRFVYCKEVDGAVHPDGRGLPPLCFSGHSHTFTKERIQAGFGFLGISYLADGGGD